MISNCDSSLVKEFLNEFGESAARTVFENGGVLERFTGAHLLALFTTLSPGGPADRPDLQLLVRVHPAELSGTLRSREPFVDALMSRISTLPTNVFIIR